MAPEVLAKMGLDWDQMTVNTRRPLPRQTLNRATIAALTLLRVYVLVAIPLVVFAFVHALHP